MMNKMLIKLLQTIVRAMVGALNYERVYLLVEDAEKTGLSGEEKRILVLSEVKNVALVVGQAILNLAIETAVNVLNSKKEKF